jgi:D-alanyl-D-alanine carboxypeptidase/D-alanyl-D-alanine-endopeptidase (penicillin-binding protein 4)
MTKNMLKIVLWLAVFCAAGVCRAESINQIIARHKQQKTEFAILAVDAQSGKVLYQKNANKPLIPASNMKIVSSAAALHYLGPDYVFRTKVGLLGNDVVVIGGGDPLLGEPKLNSQDPRSLNRIFDEIVTVLTEAGTKRVDDIVIDASFFDNNRVHPSWPRDQLNQWYACEISGLNFYNNCVRITAERANNRPTLKMEPTNSFVTLVNQLKLVSSGSSAVGAYRNHVPNKLSVRGNLNQQAGFDVAIEQPQGLFASILSDRLKGAGISVEGQILQKYVKADPSIRVLKTFETPISDVLMRCNKDSLGLAAESLVKTISAENTQGQINGEWGHGLTLIARYLQSLDIPADHFVLDDGSGLSRKNQLSPTALVAVLKDIYVGRGRDIFVDSLAIGGTDGTISRYFRQAPYKGNICGKTGYIANVRTFSGICKTPRGDIIFSILTEGGSSVTRTCINDIAQAFYDGSF